MSSRQQFLLPNVTPGARVRIDTASGSNSAADVVNNLNQAISGSIITADASGRLASGDIYGPAGVTTLYLKTLDGSGNVTGSPTTLGATHPVDTRVDAILAGAPSDKDSFGEVAALLSALPGTYFPFARMAANPDLLTFGAITRDVNGAALSAPAVWPDGSTGIYTADTVSTAFPGAVDAYHVTKVTGGVTTTYTQPAVTRDASTGAVTNRPALTVV